MHTCHLCHYTCEDAAPRYDVGVIACEDCYLHAKDGDA